MPVLRHVLAEQTSDLRHLDLAGFRCWLEKHLTHWRHDPVFAQRVRIRDLRRRHPRLRALERQHRCAVAADADSPHFHRLHHLERELTGIEKAIAGLTAALPQAVSPKRKAMRQKLASFRIRRSELRREQKALIQSSPQRQTLRRLDARLRRLRSATGLDHEERRLAQLLQQQGQHSGRAGASFERLARTVPENRIMADLHRGKTTGGLRVLHGVTLGAARVEFDQLVIRLPRHGGEPVAVLAIVEVKRNLNDLGHGFQRHQDDLLWLTGAGTYDPKHYRTRQFPSGHFDREAVHQQDGATFHFTRGSFSRFRRDRATGMFLDRLYFITRRGPLWGLARAAMARIAFRVATDEHWEPGSDAYLGRLLRWCQALAGDIESPDVLQCYAATSARARQILFVETSSKGHPAD